MKKLLFIFLLIGMISCKEEVKDTKIETTYQVEVLYLDNAVDTIIMSTYGDYKPYVYARDGMSTLEFEGDTQASYVKRFKVISKTKLVQ